MADKDAWNAYFWEPDGHVLRNLLGVRDPGELRDREYAVVAFRTDELRRGVVTIEQTFGLDHHRAVHRHLFQDIYAWAGEVRTVELAKGASEFADRADVKRVCDAAARVAVTTEWATITRADFGQALAEIYSWMNFAHPFREGNGRTAKVVLDHVAALSPFELHYELVDKSTWDRAAILTMPDRGASTPQPRLAVPLFTMIAIPRGESASAEQIAADLKAESVRLIVASHPLGYLRPETTPASEDPTDEARATRSRRLRAGSEVSRSDYDNPGRAPEAGR